MTVKELKAPTLQDVIAARVRIRPYLPKTPLHTAALAVCDHIKPSADRLMIGQAALVPTAL